MTAGEAVTRSESIAARYRAEALSMSTEHDAPTHHECVWSDVAGAVAFALSIRHPDWSEYQVTCEAERMLMHLQIDDSVTGLRTTRDLECGACCEVITRAEGE